MTEPERLTVVKFNRLHLLSLRAYVDCGVRLPTTIQAYTDTFLVSSDVAKHADFESKIGRVVLLHISIHDHCSSFQKEFFEKDKVLPDKICSHLSEVEASYPALFGYLKELNKQDENKTQDKNKRELALLALDDEIEFFEELENAAIALINTLQGFENNTLEDYNQLELTLRHLDSVDTHGETDLKMSVDAVKLEKKRYEMQDEEEELCWVRLLGYIPTALRDMPVVKSAITSINNILDGRSKSDAIMNDIVVFQVQFMSKHLKDMKNKLDNAIKAVRLLQGYFNAISHDLKELEQRVRKHANNSGRKPLEYRQQKLDAVIMEWRRLHDRADAYRQLHFDRPVEQRGPFMDKCL